MKNNRSMKKSMVMMAIALLGTLSVHAQDKKEGQPMNRAWVAINTEMLNVQLKLNDVQKEQVREINERYVKKHEALVASAPKPTEEEMSDRVEALMASRDKAMREVLNADQYAEWEKKRHMGTSELDEEQKETLKEEKK